MYKDNLIFIKRYKKVMLSVKEALLEMKKTISESESRDWDKRLIGILEAEVFVSYILIKNTILGLKDLQVEAD